MPLFLSPDTPLSPLDNLASVFETFAQPLLASPCELFDPWSDLLTKSQKLGPVGLEQFAICPLRGHVRCARMGTPKSSQWTLERAMQRSLFGVRLCKSPFCHDHDASRRHYESLAVVFRIISDFGVGRYYIVLIDDCLHNPGVAANFHVRHNNRFPHL